ncbi:glycosyltransferase involved in cell wall biosynthesis [Massilia aurea]|uniref:Glycosyltransferase involved in cell wall biosynthesis n=1 Tax=Massilia aurea TaxID=373040 RepID=A0A7W9WX32_9BURK|nr:glycosyltransferase family 4 protein [Massilia aurea]MBB6131910.1 glycosyltransferase involved in cell wall biosynthesis [Massilia aurea]
MQLLIYIHSLENGGAERVVANLANYWASLGWAVTVVTVASQVRDFYVLDAGVGRRCLDLAGQGGGLLAGVVRTARRARALRRVLREVQPTVALSAMHTANVVLALAARGLPGVRTVGSEHNFPPKAPMGMVWETLRRHAYGHLHAVVALTHECSHWLERHSHARRVPVIPNPVVWPLSQHAPQVSPATSCAPGRQILLGVGRLSEEKNFTTLIAIFARLAPLHPDWDLVILGEGAQRAALSAQVQAGGLGQRVFLPGSVGNVGDWYARASLYAMSSHFEGFPNTLVEAMAYGLPAVSFDCDTGPRDIIRHGIDGVLVAPGDVEGMASALDTLMRDSRARARFARHAIDARERFSMEKISRMWETVFMPSTCTHRLEVDVVAK